METVFSEDIPLDRNAETYEFNIGRAAELRCSQTTEDKDCGECESCLLTDSIISTKNWYWRCSHQVQKKFLMGVIQRFHSVDLLKSTVQLLKPLLSKDFTYARNRVTPSLETDRATSSSDRALSMVDVETSMKYTWNWFASSNYWTKSNFFLGLMQLCDIHLLFMVANHAKTLLATEVKALASREEQYDHQVASLVSTSRYTSAVSRPRTAPEIIREKSPSRMSPQRPRPPSHHGLRVHSSGAITNDESDEEDNPTLYIMPNSEKAIVGVSKYKDFIKELPVHLSKCILGYFDEATLFTCSKVSHYWQVLVGEMKAEFYANQQMWEDIMLMQGSSGVNPQYANDIDVLVPNLKPDSWECIRTTAKPYNKVQKDERFKSEMNIENAYTGYVVRKVIMEERNLYCGSYNVLILVNESDKHRVIHTCGGNYLTFSKDRRCHLIDITTGRDTEHPIAGHSGPIKCVNIQEEEGFVLTGSFDTSVRKWDLKTLKCVKIYNGHQETVVAIDYCKKSGQFASASLDKACKVWSIDSKKCLRTFKHRGKISAVSLGETQCITGCEQGRVKVWHLATGKLIKMLLGHDGPITAIRFDRWHIITTSHDGYALAWSNQGNHRRCLTALRHPCPVLCMEFMYLRVITGAEDGRVRIWNMISGQCCRIMRGNSQSDPILGLHAIDDRLTINTKSNVLMMTFESIDWDYSNETDKVVTFVENNKYPDAPLRNHTYAYIRAQRMARTGSSDRRLLKKADKPRFSRCTSARSTTSGASMNTASGITYPEKYIPDATATSGRHLTLKDEPEIFPADCHSYHGSMPRKSMSAACLDNDDRSVIMANYSNDKRRVSWAFEHPVIPSCEEPSLGDIKALFKKQIRNSVTQPDYVYLTVAALKNQVLSTYPYESSNCHHPEFPSKKSQAPFKPVNARSILRCRPKSSPSCIDTKAKGSLTDSMEELMDHEDCKSTRSGRTSAARTSKSARSSLSNRSKYVREANPVVEPRPQSATVLRVQSAGPPRSQSAGITRRVQSAENKQKSGKSAGSKKTYHGMTTSCTEASFVPMLMYPKGGLKPNVDSTNLKKFASQETIAKNHPLSSGSTMKLRTFTEESKLMAEIRSSKSPAVSAKVNRPQSCAR